MDHIDKLLARIPKKHRLQIVEALDCLANPACRGTLRAEKLSGSKSLYRTRVGKYRILFHINERGQAIIDDMRLRNEGTYKNL